MSAILKFENVSCDFGSRRAVDDVSFEIAPQQTLCLLGASGCGKTTSLRLAAGIERPNAGRIYIDGRCVSARDIHIPPESRGLGFLFQDYALFPHLTIAQNIGFGLHKRSDAAQIVDELLTRVGLCDYAQNYPASLSGGEQQRVALARALAPRPALVLMDEPFASLDPQLRDAMRVFTKRLLREMEASALIVTHDAADAMRLGDIIAVQNRGRLVQLAPPEEIYAYPATREVALIFGTLNEWAAVVKNGALSTPLGDIPFAVDDGNYQAAVRPSDIYLDGKIEDGFQFEADLIKYRRLGADWLVNLRLADGSIIQAHHRSPKPPTRAIHKLSIAKDAIMLFRDGKNHSKSK